jgi:hypothetical protein
MGLEKKKRRRNAYRIQPQEEIKLWNVNITLCTRH